jgi:hypothetical protein
MVYLNHVYIIPHSGTKTETGYVARTWGMRNAFVLVRKLDSKGHLRKAYVNGRIILKEIFKTCV